MKARIVIIGGGVMGISIAAQLARQTDALKEPIMLLERGSVGGGTSGRSSTILRQFNESRCIASMARDSLRFYSRFEDKIGRSIGFLRTGVLTLAKSQDPADIEQLEELVAMQATMGIDITRVSAREIRNLIPGAEVEAGTVGAWECSAGCVDSTRTLEAFSCLARNKGAILRPGTTVEKILVKAGRVCGVRTAEGDIQCEDVVVAAGPWTRGLLLGLGLDYPLNITRTEHLHVTNSSLKEAEAHSDPEFGMHGPESSGATSWISRDKLDAALADEAGEGTKLGSCSEASVLHPTLIDPQLGFYARCDPLHARARVGRCSAGQATPVADPDHLDERIDDEFRDWVRATLSRRLPAYEDAEEVGAEVRMCTETKDSRALIGPTPEIKGLYLVSGFSGCGFKLAPSVGEGVAQMLLGQPVSAFEPEYFAPARFSALRVPG
jgi:glycine/D-amino acid oxidase-like deaminating enzyme